MKRTHASNRQRRLFSHALLWIWSAVLVSCLVCMTLYWLHLQQRQTLQLALSELEGIRQARIDLNKGFLHLTLADRPGAPFGRAEGLALLQQAIASFEQPLTDLAREEQEAVRLFRSRVAGFQENLTQWKNRTGAGIAQEVALRVAFNELELQADRIDTLTQLHLRELSDRLDRQFAVALVSAALLLALICGVIFNAGRTADKLTLKSRESEERFRTIFEKTTAGYSLSTPEGTLLMVNRAFAEMLGYLPEELLQHHFSTLVHPDDLADYDQRRRRTLAGEIGSFHFEWRFLHREGRIVWTAGSFSLLLDERGEPGKFITNLQDISDAKKAEEELAENRRFLSDLIEHSGALIFTKNRDGRYELVNRKWEEVTGLSRQETLGKSDSEIFPKAVGEEFRANDLRAMAANEVTELEEVLATEGGERHFISIKFPIRNEQGEVLGLCGMSTEITERKKAEEALRESENRLRFAMEGTNDGVWDMNMVTGATYLSPRGCEILGYLPDELSETEADWSELVHPDDLQCTRDRLQAHIEGRVPFFEAEQRLRTKGGGWIPVLTRGKIVSRAQDCTPLRMTGVHTDLSQQKKLEEQFLQAQKMEAVGRLAGGVAHDFNNMLLVIMGYADIALSQIDQAHPLYKMLLDMRRAAERSADLTQQLLAFARKQTVAPKVLNLNEAVARTLAMLQRLIGEQITLVWLPKAGIWRIKVDPAQVDQILANMCVNARDAIAGTGKITIETGNVVLDEAYCVSRPDCVPGDYVLLAISDDGCGMDKETAARIFEPFFTTKALGQGTGLGLSTVYGIVKQNLGHISVYSEPGQGTTFRVYFPRDLGDAVTVAEEGLQDVPMGGGETVLVVEDEPRILEMIQNMLKLQGYQPLTAASPDEALRIAEERAGEIKLLLTDVVMPGMNGRDLSRKLQSSRPALKTLFMSGYTANAIAHHGVLDEGIEFIQKPFSMRDLALKIKSVLTS